MFRSNRRFLFLHHRTNFIAAVTPASVLPRFPALGMPRMVAAAVEQLCYGTGTLYLELLNGTKDYLVTCTAYCEAMFSVSRLWDPSHF
jgi:hypothetical protein